MQHALDETERRREIQLAYNQTNNITPQGIRKAIHDITERVQSITETNIHRAIHENIPPEDILQIINELEKEMHAASDNLEFETAALIRDQITDLRKVLADDLVKLK